MATQSRRGVSKSQRPVNHRPGRLEKYLDLAYSPQGKFSAADADDILNARSLNENSLILRLPNEVLQLCLQAAIQRPYGMSLDDKVQWMRVVNSDKWTASSTSYALLFTCKRFHDVSLPLLYGDIDMNYLPEWNQRPSREELFCSTIMRNPSLRPMIRHLAVTGQSLRSDVVRIACMLPLLKSFSMHAAGDSIEDSTEKFLIVSKRTTIFRRGLFGV